MPACRYWPSVQPVNVCGDGRAVRAWAIPSQTAPAANACVAAWPPVPPPDGGLTVEEILQNYWVLRGMNPDDLLAELGGIPPGYTDAPLLKVLTRDKDGHCGR